MKAATSTSSPSPSLALTKGTCPVRGILKDFQWALAETSRPQSDLRLCNLHGWALARSREKLSRSTPGESVTMVFLEMLKGPLTGEVSSDQCSLCHHVLGEEVTRLHELAQKLRGAMFAEWMKTPGNPMSRTWAEK
jgi:hypothetical protein